MGGALTSAILLPEALALSAPLQATATDPSAPDSVPQSAASGAHVPADFRFAPVGRQTAICFPDDPHKTLVNEKGELLYDYSESFFHRRFSFGLCGMQPVKSVTQKMEAPSVPILQTTFEQADTQLTLTTFATHSADEGRVDNVLIEVRPLHQHSINVSPFMLVSAPLSYKLTKEGKLLIVNDEKGGLLFVAKVFNNPSDATFRTSSFLTDINTKQQLTLHQGIASPDRPYRAILRFPQAGQKLEQIAAGLDAPDDQLQATRKFWASWVPFQKPVSWSIPDRNGEFVTACARNILQAREVKDGKLTFQVGASCYRGLWVVDGNFILESARYLGYEKEAIEGLKTTWAKQQSNGQIIAGGGHEHYKDTAIAMFTMARQCELSQDWSLLKEMEPNVVSGIQFLDSLRARARAEGSSLGKYGLLAKGFADGGLDGVRNEMTNTLWAMAALKAIGAAGEEQHLPRVAQATTLYKELLTAFNLALPHEMRSYEGKFDYLPMLMKDDSAWDLADPWDRPRPQSAQWALSHTIFPGRVFDPSHPVIKGHVALMKAITREGIPSETGWNHHESVWTYNAPFVAEVYLWLGMKQAAHDTFIGFLNHASPQYCWREEQPLQNSVVGTYVGDMPHNWASAECIRYLRHIFALEDGPHLRLLAGITEGEIAAGKPYAFRATPTRFGPLDLDFEPLDRQQGWRLSYLRGSGPVPEAVSVPETLASNFHLVKAEGVALNRSGDSVLIDPAARQWNLTWKA